MTELLIQKALGELLRGRTSFVIAHRLSTIRNADQVLVLEQGEIIERGTHATLMEQRGRYYDLYMSQFRREQQTGVRVSARPPEPAVSDQRPRDRRGDGQGRRRRWSPAAGE